jgi:hypothetical protein
LSERPILFNGPMVRAILAGTKTQTRRLVKPQPAEWLDTHEPTILPAACPYGVPGDRLWVRETWSAPLKRDGSGYESAGVLYRADPLWDGMSHGDFGWDWKPSIHMPRWASRLTLEVTDVRVQRLQDINEEDAKAEGVTPYTPPHGNISLEQTVPGPGFDGCRLGDQPHRLPFADLWDSINAKRAPWDSNPWVWAVTFRRAA